MDDFLGFALGSLLGLLFCYILDILECIKVKKELKGKEKEKK